MLKDLGWTTTVNELTTVPLMFVFKHPDKTTR